MQQLVERCRIDAQDSLFFRDQAFARHVHRDFDRCFRGALAIACLEHPELAFLDSKFQVLHVAVMPFELFVSLHKLIEHRGHHLFHGKSSFTAFFPCELCQVLGSTNARHNVFTLRIDQKLTIESTLAGGRVPREGDTGC